MSPLRNATLLMALAASCAAVAGPLGCGGGDTSSPAGGTDASIADASNPDGASESSTDSVADGAAESGDGACSDGFPGCACLSGGFCTKGECVKDKCVDCTRGGDACICRLNGTCDAGLKCTDGVCAKCTEGTSGCPCTGGTTCDAGLKCSGGTCVADTCAAGAAGCGCRATAPRCDTSLYCNAGSTCAACSSDVAGCPCSAGSCTGLVCEVGTCRAARTCANLVATSVCALNQKCIEGTKEVDAVCVADTCDATYRWDTASKSCIPCGLPGFRWDATGSSCIKCSNAACDAEPCGADPLAATCAASARGCKLDADGKVTACGGCLEGYAVPTGGGPTSTCIARSLCGAAPCATTEWCDRSGTSPTCVPRKCPVGQAVNAIGMCASCGSLVCSGAGTTGAIWPTMTKDERCICETQPDYFVRSGAQLPELCDADNDGWVRVSADDNAVRTDPTLTVNARCKFQRVGAVHLVDEYGVEKIIDSCSVSLRARTGTAAGCPSGESVVPIRLVEADLNDGPDLRTDSMAPTFKRQDGSIGRIAANQLNGLTKFCTPSSDGDLDLTDDVQQAQVLKPGPDDPIAGTMPRLRSFAYFAELYTSRYIAPTTGTNGDLYIYERSRCEESFPLHYDPGVDPTFTVPLDVYTPSNGSTYWRNCARNRDYLYNGTAGPTAGPGMDFAQWSCSDPLNPNGTCTSIPAAASKDDIGPLDPKVKFMRNHGVCNLAGNKPKDGKFRGMNHHSQFKCVNIVTTPTKPWERAVAEFEIGKRYTYATCTAASCGSGSGICSVPSGAGGTSASTSPGVRCRAQVALTGGASFPSTVSTTGWALVNYASYGSSEAYASGAYAGGCINEDTHWQSDTCPYPQFVSSVLAESTTSLKDHKTLGDKSFGRYSCYGEDQNYLWAPEPVPTPVDISSLYWSDSAGLSDNMSVVR